MPEESGGDGLGASVSSHTGKLAAMFFGLGNRCRRCQVLSTAIRVTLNTTLLKSALSRSSGQNVVTKDRSLHGAHLESSPERAGGQYSVGSPLWPYECKAVGQWHGTPLGMKCALFAGVTARRP